MLLRPAIWERYGLQPWIEAAAQRLHHNEVLAIALANKLERIPWSVLHHAQLRGQKDVTTNSQAA